MTRPQGGTVRLSGVCKSHGRGSNWCVEFTGNVEVFRVVSNMPVVYTPKEISRKFTPNGQFNHLHIKPSARWNPPLTNAFLYRTKTAPVREFRLANLTTPFHRGPSTMLCHEVLCNGRWKSGLSDPALRFKLPAHPVGEGSMFAKTMLLPH